MPEILKTTNGIIINKLTGDTYGVADDGLFLEENDRNESLYLDQKAVESVAQAAQGLIIIDKLEQC
jgi:hypothetical protein